MAQISDEIKYSIFQHLLQKVCGLIPSAKDSEQSRGNLAYLVWHYCGRPKWPEIVRGINDSVESKNVSQLCIDIVKLNLDFYENNQPDDLEYFNTACRKLLFYDAYRRGVLTRFNIILNPRYPLYFYAHDPSVSHDRLLDVETRQDEYAADTVYAEKF